MASRSNVVTWTDDDRRELRELCRVHDQMMAEQRANDPGEELVFKVMEDARPPVPEPEPAPFTEAQGDAIAHVIVELRKQWREERDAAIAPLEPRYLPTTRLTTMAAMPASTALAIGDDRMSVIGLDADACC